MSLSDAKARAILSSRPRRRTLRMSTTFIRRLRKRGIDYEVNSYGASGFQ